MNIDTKKDTKIMILDAAFDVFVKNGYNDTTISHIVSESGLSKGAIYHYYPSKKELFLGLIDHWEVFSFPDFYSKNNKGESASETLKRFADVVYDTFCKKPHVFLAEIEFWALANKDKEINDRSKISTILYKNQDQAIFEQTFSKIRRSLNKLLRRTGDL